MATVAPDSPRRIGVITANANDAPALIDLIAEAFLGDPTWSWAFPDPAARRQWWTFCITEALRYPWTFRSEGFETASVWIPPSCAEFSNEGAQGIPGKLTDLAEARATEVMELLHRFEQAHPSDEPHYYLSLLGTCAAHRGRGLGMALLKENLARIDAEHMPAYLESSNPGNNDKYESVGFVPIASFQAPGDGPVVTGMWRKGR
ncbi:GNAT family N-acetyltransferase [Hyphomicrobium sp.]|jgi:GNAT superfamily N-acetyltransferase|uniref:GNAT family N-acetyltransferase n=1 Tax=Hyphomicrobium sp. TaxID=82 RepID=UPI003569764E